MNGGIRMQTVRRYTCVVQCGMYRVVTNVFTSRVADIEQLALDKASRHAKRLFRLPAELIELKLVRVIDRGPHPGISEDSLTERLAISG